jgi:hypothetical protein
LLRLIAVRHLLKAGASGQVNPDCDRSARIRLSAGAIKRFPRWINQEEPGQGTGLGLSQVYGFVKQSGGHVKMYSEVGQGTSIRMYFPRYHGDARPVDSDSDELRPEGEKLETILVVEDDADLRAYVSELLRDLNYRVVPASSAQAALTILLQEEPKVDLLLTDVVMPGIMDGSLVGALNRYAQASRSCI